MLTKEDNIIFVKKIMPELIFNSAYIEGCKVTLEETQMILDESGTSTSDLASIMLVLSLKDAWYFILDNLDKTISPQLVEQLWNCVADGGHMGLHKDQLAIKRVIEVVKQSHKPQEPIEKVIMFFINSLKENLFGVDTLQMTLLLVNRTLIKSGLGVLSITPELYQEIKDNKSNVPTVKECLYRGIKSEEYHNNMLKYKTWKTISKEFVGKIYNNSYFNK